MLSRLRFWLLHTYHRLCVALSSVERRAAAQEAFIQFHFREGERSRDE